jgi:hypothetical protein
MQNKCVAMSGLAVLIAFVMGYASPDARADPPPKCLMYECKVINAFWIGSPTTAWRVHLAATDAESSDAYENIFTPQSNDQKKPAVADDPEVALLHRSYDACTPWCGLDANGKWQAPQEVYIPTEANRLGVSAFVNRSTCTSHTGKGPTIENPTNMNTQGNTPPGVK